MKAGMIGLGAMGLGMARNLAKAGYLTAVYNRTAAKASEFKVATYQSPEALAAEVDIVLICVSADQDVLSIVEAIALTIKPGSIVVDMSTVSS
jgi:3-hydroxyisobutyrate dehydrogenase